MIMIPTDDFTIYGVRLHISPLCAICNKKAEYSSRTNTQPSLILMLVISALTDPEHLCSTR